MSEDQSPGDVVNLDMDMSNVSTDYPLMRQGPCRFQVASIEIKNGKKDPNSKNLVIKLKTLEPSVDHRTGTSINAGLPLFHNITLTPTGKLTEEMIQRSLGQFMDATLGHHTTAFNPLEQYLGVDLTANVKIESSVEYGDQNRISNFIKKS